MSDMHMQWTLYFLPHQNPNNWRNHVGRIGVFVWVNCDEKKFRFHDQEFARHALTDGIGLEDGSNLMLFTPIMEELEDVNHLELEVCLLTKAVYFRRSDRKDNLLYHLALVQPNTLQKIQENWARIMREVDEKADDIEEPITEMLEDVTRRFPTTLIT